MSDEQAERMISYLALIAQELSDLKAGFEEFRAYGTRNLDAVTGPLGYSLEDIHTKLEDMHGTLVLIDANTAP